MPITVLIGTVAHGTWGYIFCAISVCFITVITIIIIIIAAALYFWVMSEIEHE